MPKKHKKITQTPGTKITRSFEQTRDAVDIAHAAARRMDRLRGALHNFKPLELYHEENRIPRDLRIVEDRRTIPRPFRQGRYLRVDGIPTGPRYVQVPVQNRVPWLREAMRLRFPLPEKTLVCVRRKTRRRVLFALRKNGKGGGKQRPPRWTAQSYVRCK